MGVLEGKRVYLGGPIECQDPTNWRTDVKKILTEEFGLIIMDPFDDPKQQWAPQLFKARQNKNFGLMRAIAKKFVRKDLSWVDRADFTIHNLPYKIPTTGSVHEIVYANDAKKPTLLICEQGREFLPFWYFGNIHLRYMFDNWEQIYSYLREVEAGKHIKDNRWHFVYGII